MNRKSRLWWLLLVIPLVLLGGIELLLWWNHVHVQPPRPPEKPPAPVAMAATVSNLSVPVSLPTKAIAAVLETAIPKTFHFDSKNGARAYGTPSRKPITVTSDVAHKRVAMSTAVGGRVQVEKTVVAKISVGIDVAGSISAFFAPVVAPNRTIDPHLDLSVHVDNAVAKTAVGGIGVTGLVRGGVNDALTKVRPRIQEELVKALQIRPRVEAVWNKINDAYRGSETPPAWLRVTPRAVTFANFRYTPDSLESGLALTLDTHVFLQADKPQPVKAPLPNLSIADKVPDNFEISLPVEASYTSINEQLKAQLSKAPFNLPGNAWVSITGVTLEPYGDGVLLIVDFRGQKGFIRSASGRVYIVGVPLFDAAKEEFRVDKLKYAAETQNLLLANVEWIAHSKLLDAMKAAAVVNLSGEMKKAKDKANEEVGKLKTKLPKEIGASVTVTGISIDRLVFAKERAFALIRAKGKMSARLVK